MKIEGRETVSVVARLVVEDVILEAAGRDVNAIPSAARDSVECHGVIYAGADEHTIQVVSGNHVPIDDVMRCQNANTD
jgi:hypothetical protein